MPNRRRSQRRQSRQDRYQSEPSPRQRRPTLLSADFNNRSPRQYLHSVTHTGQAHSTENRRSDGGGAPSRITPAELRSRSTNPAAANRIRILRSQGILLFRELEKMIKHIDALQPDSADMEWAASAGTIVYVPCPADGGIPAHPGLVGPNSGFYPSPNEDPHSTLPSTTIAPALAAPLAPPELASTATPSSLQVPNDAVAAPSLPTIFGSSAPGLSSLSVTVVQDGERQLPLR